MALLPTPSGPIEYLVAGLGGPVTVFAHGLGGSIPETRPFGSGVLGTRVFLQFRAHGPAPWTYGDVAADLAAVADHVDATRAFGVSLGAGALTRLLSTTPGRFERVVFVLPSVLDQPRGPAAERLLRLAAVAELGDVDGAAALLLAEQPRLVRDRADVRQWVRRQAGVLVSAPVGNSLRAIAAEAPVADRGQLAAVAARALVIAQQDDAAHPVAVAESLAAAFPSADLVVLPPGGVLWSHRQRTRELISGFLNDDAVTSTRRIRL
jgi:pimeloyl-ACP methyl ester carboxylesterase